MKSTKVQNSRRITAVSFVLCQCACAEIGHAYVCTRVVFSQKLYACALFIIDGLGSRNVVLDDAGFSNPNSVFFCEINT